MGAKRQEVQYEAEMKLQNRAVTDSKCFENGQDGTYMPCMLSPKRVLGLIEALLRRQSALGEIVRAN